ncbi:MAG: histidine kinase [Flavobacteriaceae bacterium]
MKFWLLFASMLLFASLKGLGQDPYSVKYSIEEGLPTLNVYSVLEDSKGYLWFATDVGVLKYDGYQFLHFNTDNGLGDNEIFKIREDHQGRLWFLSLNGKLSFYKDGVFYNAQNLEMIGDVSHTVMSIDFFEDENKTLHFLFMDGHISSLTTKNEITTMEFEGATRLNSFWRHGDKTYIMTESKISTLDRTLVLPLETNFEGESAFRYVYQSSEGYYFSFKNIIFVYRYGTHIEEFMTIPEASEIIFINYLDGHFWIGTRNGLFVQEGSGLKHYFKNDQVSSIIKDRQGSYWVTTLTNGIKYLPNLSVTTYHLKKNKTKINALQKDSLNQLWIGTTEGVLVKPVGKQPIKSYLEGLSEEESKVKRIRPLGKSMTVITKSIFLIQNDRIKEFNFSVNDLIAYDENLVFAGSNHIGTITFKNFKTLENAEPYETTQLISQNKLLGKRSNVMQRVGRKIYIGTSTGLYVFEEGKITQAKVANDELSTSILDLKYREKSEELWIATNSKGVIVLAADTVKRKYNTLKGLKSNTCYSLEPWKEKGMFVGNNKGIDFIPFSPDEAKIISYGTLLNLRNEKVNDLELLNDQLYVASDSGLYSFLPEKVTEKHYTPILEIDEITVNGEKKRELDQLKYWENNITVSYTGISPIDFGEVQYEYKLNNDTDWNSAIGRQLEFKKLNYGRYELQIRAKGHNGLYGNVSAIGFTITPPFWKTAPFYIGTATLLSLLLFWIGQRAFRRMRQKYDRENKRLHTEQEKVMLEKKMIELEQKALRLQMNPHFIFNTLNTIKGYYSGGDIKDANLYISRFSKLLRMILENDEHLVPLDKEIEMMGLYIQLIQLRYANTFEYHVAIDPNISKEEIGIPPLLLQPLVENSIIHGLAPLDRKGHLEVSFQLEAENLVCRVRDNGVGFENSKKEKAEGYQSKALKITRDRVRFINHSEAPGQFEIKTLPLGGGTEVVVKIPLIKLW